MLGLYNHAWFPGTCNGAAEVRGTEACRKPGHWVRALIEGNSHTQLSHQTLCTSETIGKIN